MIDKKKGRGGRKREGQGKARSTRLVEGTKNALALLREKTAEAKADHALVADVCFAVRKLAETEPDQLGLPEGPLGILVDLRNKADAVESTHSPDTIQDLLDALDAFLGEELREKPGDASGDNVFGMDTDSGGEGSPMLDSNAEEMSGDEPGVPGGDEGLMQRKAAAEADNFGRYAAVPASDPTDKPGEKPSKAMQCEACGHQMSAPSSGGAMEQKKEAAKADPTATELAEKLAEANQKIQSLETKLTEAERKPAESENRNLSEADRTELFTLRAEKKLAEKTGKAVTAIKEAGLDGIVEPQKLVAFEESQWPLMLEGIAGSTPTRTYGTGEIDMPVRQPVQRRTRQTESAADIFKRQYGTAGLEGLDA